MMGIIEMEKRLHELHAKKLKIVDKLELGKIDEESAQELYEPISKEYNKLYLELQKIRNENFEKMVAIFS